jgi:hypothetical protein
MSRPSLWARRAAIAAVFAVPVTAAAGWPLAALIDESVLVDVTPAGFDSLEDLASTLVPPEIVVPDVHLYDESCANVLGVEICTYTADIDVTGMEATVNADSLSIAPAEGQLNLDGDIIVQLNSAAAPATLSFKVTGLGIPISDTCDVYTLPITVEFSGAVQLETEPDLNGLDIDGDGLSDTKALDATIPPLSWDWDVIDDDIKLVGCGTGTVINVLNDALDLFGFASIYELILDQIEPNGPAAPGGQIQAIVDDLPGMIEPIIEDTFSTLFIQQTIDLLGVPITLALWPDAVETHADGLRVAVTSSTYAPPNECVAPWNTGESVSTSSLVPGIGEAPPIAFTPHAGVLIDDDFLNQVLYGAWSGGLLCFDLSDDNSTLDLPIPLNSALLAILADDEFDHLFPETTPLVIRTEPRAAPVIGPPGVHDVSVVADELGLEFVAEVEGRQARVLGIDLDADVGADLGFDGTTGTLSVAVDLSPGVVQPTVAYNEFAPDASGDIEDSFQLLLDGLVIPIVKPYVEGLQFPLPSLEGFGVANLDVEPSGSNGDYVGAFAMTGPVVYTSTGCGTAGGCDTSSCSNGCSSGGGAVFVFGWPLVIAALRRRRA